MVLTQAATAVGFWKLFQPVHPVAAGSIAAFGLVNAVTILLATTLSATALTVALRADATSAGETLLLYNLHATASSLGGMFFGLWLIPMGWLAHQSGYMPRPLGWILLSGGAGYLLSVPVAALDPNTSGIAYALTVPATIGELWMVGYLLTKGTRGMCGCPDVGDRSADPRPRSAPPVFYSLNTVTEYALSSRPAARSS